ncbi:MATE family efflux transporter [Endozoicomonas ascidiicola]|uniref:MATE family efflux transporter n=1 Tax=Endozoicomonas ascidiicola TaxID=1698521 RepID=UPI000832E85B|nr:MATE family efflux transporter [Endozoicomonas ascidiicola]
MITQSSDTQLTNREFLHNLWQLALPISLQSMMFSMLGLIDIFMVSMLGETEVAAVGIGNRIFFFNLILIASMGSGMSILAAQYIGARNIDGVRRTLVQTIIASLVVSIPFVVLYLSFPQEIMAMVSEDSSLGELGRSYLVITAPSILFIAITIPFEALLRTSNDAKTPTRIGFITILLNVLFNYLLIYGKFGFPALGVAGSAWGTAISRLIQVGLIIYYIVRVKPDLIPNACDFIQCRIPKHWLKYISICVPMLLQDGLWSFGLILYNLMFARMGVEELAVMSAISSVEGVLISLFIGFAIATSILLGKELGAGNFDMARKQGRFAMIVAPLSALTFGVVTLLFSKQIVSMFGEFDSDTAAMAQEVLIIAGFAIAIRVINLTGIIGVLRSGGDVKATAVINIIGMWGVGIPLTWVAINHWHLPLYLVFICALMEEGTKAVLVLYRIMKGVWLKNLATEN